MREYAAQRTACGASQAHEAPFFVNCDPIALGAGPRLSPPSLALPLGTDELGRSHLPRLVGGILETFLLSGAAVLLTGVIGVFIGILAAYFRGFTDGVIARFADVLFAFPAIILGLLVVSLVGPGTFAVITVITAATLPLFIRAVRSVALGIAAREFVTATEVAGTSPLRIMAVHLLPNIAGAAIVQLTYALSIGMLIRERTELPRARLAAAQPFARLPAAARRHLHEHRAVAGVSGRHRPRARHPVGEPRGRRTARCPRSDRRAAPDMSALVRALDLVVDYETPRGVVRALDGASFELPPGRSLGLVGESGSGKSTLGLAIGRLLPGNARRTGGDLRSERALGVCARRRRNPLPAPRSPRLRLPESDGRAGPDDADRAPDRLRLRRPARGRPGVGFSCARSDCRSTRRAPFAHELSGGMAQRAVIAMAIARGPRLLVADEPTAALDTSLRAQILDLLVALKDESGAALVLLSHELPVVARICDRIGVMYGGRVVEFGDSTAVFANPLHPYSAALLATAQENARPGERLAPIPGMPPVLSGPCIGCSFAPRCALADDRCRSERPPLRSVAGRLAACHHAETVSEGRSREARAGS